MSTRANNYNTGVASEYFVLSQLYRLGFEAYITIGNKKSVDIRVVQGDVTLTIDVKAVQGYSSLIVNNVASRHNHYIIFLIYNNKFEDLLVMPELYVVPSEHVKSITKSFGDQHRVFKGSLDIYKNNWQCLFNEKNNSDTTESSDSVC